MQNDKKIPARLTWLSLTKLVVSPKQSVKEFKNFQSVLLGVCGFLFALIAPTTAHAAAANFPGVGTYSYLKTNSGKYLGWGFSTQWGSNIQAHLGQNATNHNYTWQIVQAPDNGHGSGFYNIIDVTKGTCLAVGDGSYENSRGSASSAGYAVELSTCDYTNDHLQWKIEDNGTGVQFKTNGYVTNYTAHCIGDDGSGSDVWVRNASPACGAAGAQITFGAYTPSAPDHIQISQANATSVNADGTTTKTITITSCSNAYTSTCTVKTSDTQTVTIATSLTGSTLTTSPVTLVAGQATLTIKSTTAGTAQLSVTSASTTAGTNSYSCTQGGTSGAQSAGGGAVAACAVTFTLSNFRISGTSTSNNCSAIAVTIKAVDGAGNTVTNYTGTISISNSTAHGTWSLNTGGGSFSPGAADSGLATYTYAAGDSGVVVLNLLDTHAETTNVNVVSGSITESASYDPNFIYTAATGGLTFSVPNLLAAKPSGSVTLSSSACSTLFKNTTQNVAFSFGYTSPNSGSNVVAVRKYSPSSPGAFQNLSTSSTTNISLDFDNNGYAYIDVQYSDAGQMQLNAQYNGSGSFAGLSLAGTNTFVSTPAGLCVKSTATCASADVNCNKFVAAGKPFQLTVTGVTWESDSDTDFCTASTQGGNATTPNYAQSGIRVSSTLVAPTGTGTSGGAISPGTIDIVSGGTAQSNFTESEVGVFTFTAAPTTNGYFGATVPGGTSAAIGRFYPDHFAVSNASLVNRTDLSCPTSTFTYIGEPLTLAFKLTAQNASNTTTTNYQGAFAKLTTFAGLNALAIDTTSSRTQLTPINSSLVVNWANATDGPGVWSVSAPVSITNANPSPPSSKDATKIGPYNITAFGVAPQDSDGVATTGFNLDTAAPTADGSNDHVQIGASTKLYYGRLRLDSVSGPANTILTIPASTEYWNGAQFQLNTDDSCSTISNANASLGTYIGTSGTITPTPTSFTTTPVSAVWSGGKALDTQANPSPFKLNAPGNVNEGHVDITYTFPSTTSYLEFDWNSDTTLDATVKATATFGTYRGSDRVIFWQETK